MKMKFLALCLSVSLLAALSLMAAGCAAPDDEGELDVPEGTSALHAGNLVQRVERAVDRADKRSAVRGVFCSQPQKFKLVIDVITNNRAKVRVLISTAESLLDVLDVSSDKWKEVLKGPFTKTVVNGVHVFRSSVTNSMRVKAITFNPEEGTVVMYPESAGSEPQKFFGCESFNITN